MQAPALVEVLAEADAPLLAKPFYAGGDPGPIAATMAHVPELLGSALPFLGAVLSPGCLDLRTKEIAIVRTSALLGCRYCVDSHTPVALDAGLTNVQARALRGEAELADAFTDGRDVRLIAWIDAVAGGRGAIADDVSAAARATFTEGELVELTLLVSTTMLLNRYATALRLPVADSTIERLSKEGW